MTSPKKSRFVRIGVITITLFTIFAGFWTYNIYQRYFKSNVAHDNYLCIPTGATFAQVIDTLQKNELLKDSQSFILSAKRMGYAQKMVPGRYQLREGMSNRTIINMLISGNQAPITLSFRDIRLKKNFVGFVAKRLEIDSVTLLSLLDSADFLKRYNFNPQNVYSMFLPNSYEFYWNTSAHQFFTRMNNEYKRFWNEERLKKAKKIGLNPVEVSILASIVDAEALVNAEMPIIAGLYINRLKKGMKLESDPTVIFAINGFSIRRVLNKHLQRPSPYNTYLVDGLPPGPIMMPSIKAIDAVLNHTPHNYFYMCAKEDFSGYHNFAANKLEHTNNVNRFRAALNKRNIKR